MSLPTLSPGAARGCYEIVSLADRFSLTRADLESQFPRAFVVPSTTALELCMFLGWIRNDGEEPLRVTETGRQLLTEENAIARLRTTILEYVTKAEPAWLPNARFGRRRVISYLDSPMAQLMNEAGLISNIDSDTVGFWDRLARLSRSTRESRLTEVGRVGERLTLEYERRRTGAEPRWVALDDNGDGYDVLSCVDRNVPELLTIEVKSTIRPVSSKFFLTRNEWQRAVTSAHHNFHLWKLACSPPCLAVVGPEDVAKHIPQDQGDGNWSETQIPFDVFSFHTA